MRRTQNQRGQTLLELLFSVSLLSVVGLIMFSLLNTGMILGAKNTAVNTAHQQARMTMLKMVRDLHSAVSLPQLVDANGNAYNGNGSAAGISFQVWSIGPLKIAADSTVGSRVVQVTVPAGTQAPVAGQRLIVPTHQIEQDITAVSNTGGTTYALTLAQPVTTAISGTQAPTNYNIVCFITDRCSYVVNNQQLQWNGPATRNGAPSVIGTNVTSSAPFSTPTTPMGAPYSRFVAAVNLSTCDLKTNNRGFKSTNVVLNGQVPTRARLTTYQ